MTTYYQTGFCEGYSDLAIKGLFSDQSVTEIGNCITSIIGMLFFGFFGMLYSNNTIPLLSSFLYGFLACSGVGSVIYHGTSNEPLGSFDGIPIIGLSCLGLLGIFNEIFYELSSSRVRNRLINLASFVGTAYWVSALVSEQYYYELYRVMIGIPIVCICLFMILVHIKIDKFVSNTTNKSKNDCKKVIKFGLASGLIAFSSLILDQTLCTQSKTVLLFGHWFWHLGVSYFSMCLISVYTYLSANNFNRGGTILFAMKVIPYSYHYELDKPINNEQYSSDSSE